MSLSPRQVESVEQWLDDQPRSVKETDSLPVVTAPSRDRVGAFKEERSRHNYSRPNNNNDKNNNNNSPHPPHDRDLHVHSRLQMHSRFSRRGPDTDPDADAEHDHDFIDPVECFLRVCSACLGSAALAVGAVTYVLVHRTTSQSPSGGTPLDGRLSWVIAVPVAAVALLWQLTRLSLLAWNGGRSSSLLVVDLVLEGALAVGSVICAILAGFQAARHTAYNKKHHGETSSLYHDVGPEIALVVLLAFLSFSSFGILALNVVEANRRRRTRTRSGGSTSSSVIEIIQ